MTDQELVDTIINGMRDRGYEIVSRDLIGRISDYFHVNARPEDDLARRYMQALDEIIMRGGSPILSQISGADHD